MVNGVTRATAVRSGAGGVTACVNRAAARVHVISSQATIQMHSRYWSPNRDVMTAGTQAPAPWYRCAVAQATALAQEVPPMRANAPLIVLMSGFGAMTIRPLSPRGYGR